MENVMKEVESEIAELEQLRATWSAMASAGVPEDMMEKLQVAIAQAELIINVQNRQLSEEVREYAAASIALQLKRIRLVRSMFEIRTEIRKVKDISPELQYGPLDDGTEPKQADPRKDSEEPGSSN